MLRSVERLESSPVKLACWLAVLRFDALAAGTWKYRHDSP